MRNRAGLLSFFLILLLFVAAFVYFIPVLATGNLLWFLPVFDVQPVSIIVYRDGGQLTLYPGDPRFDEVTAASNQLISNIVAVHSTFGISDVGLEDLRAEGRAVELFYSESLDFPTPVNLGGPNQLLIPLTGHYTISPVAVRGFDGEYWGAALRLGDLGELQAVVAALEP
jgi:hypothetical protein